MKKTVTVNGETKKVEWSYELGVQEILKTDEEMKTGDLVSVWPMTYTIEGVNYEIELKGYAGKYMRKYKWYSVTSNYYYNGKAYANEKQLIEGILNA